MTCSWCWCFSTAPTRKAPTALASLVPPPTAPLECLARLVLCGGGVPLVSRSHPLAFLIAVFCFLQGADCGLFHEPETLETLTSNAIRPLAAALRDYNSLALWEVCVATM